MDVCDQCGFVYESLPTSELASTIRSLGQQIAGQIRAGGDTRAIRARPAPEVWSALEYACHVRDVLLVQRERVLLALVEDNPSSR